VVRGSMLIALLVALFAAAPALATGPRFVVITKSGHSESLSYFGYSFATSTPPIGKPGTIQVDCLAPDETTLKKALSVGAMLTSARLEISAQLPHPEHFVFRFAGARVTAMSFVTGHFGPSVSITLTFAKLSK